MSIFLAGDAVQLMRDSVLDDLVGLGTGKLREAVRKTLKAHPEVKSFRRGEQGEGGDGVTVAILD